MKKQLKYTAMAAAVAAVCASPLVMAEGYGGHHNKKDVTFDKDIRVNSNVNLIGGSLVLGITRVQAASIALVKDKQENYDNTVKKVVQDNDATVEDQALENASGNIGLNITAGNNNQQANDAAMSAVDANFVFADAETFSDQDNSGNVTKKSTITNDATMTDQAFRNASGNIGINISAGNSNQQKNDLAASVNASGTFSQATSKGSQTVSGNVTKKVGSAEVRVGRVHVSLSGNVDGTYSGGSTEGSYNGTSTGYADQVGNVYPDIWTGGSHPGGSPDGHFDLDTQTQNGTPGPNGEGALYYDTASDDSGSIGFSEEGDVNLSGTFTGYVPTQYVVYKPQTNVASISDQVLQNASGNIGVNVTAGFNNQQRNSLSLAASIGGGSSLPGSGGEN